MSHTKSKTLLGGLAAAAALVTVGAFAIPANADPIAAPSDYVAVGSDTIQDLYNGFANGYDDNGFVPRVPQQQTADGSKHRLYSYDAFPLNSTIVPKVGAPAITRPGGSGAGRQALSVAWDGTGVNDFHAVDIARSSGQPPAALRTTAGSSTDQLTYVPLARDAVDVAVGSDLNGVLTNISTADLVALYHCRTNTHVLSYSGQNATFNDGSGSITLHIELPQSNSGTRQFFLAALGVDTNNIGGCIDTTSRIPGNNGNANTLNENNAGELAPTGIVPFSAAQYLAQVNGIAANTGVGAIGMLDVDNRPAVDITVSPARAVDSTNGGLYANIGTPIPAQSGAEPTGDAVLARDVYSVVDTRTVHTSGNAVTADGSVADLVANVLPQQDTTITAFGFLPLGFAGNTSDFIHSAYELP